MGTQLGLESGAAVATQSSCLDASRCPQRARLSTQDLHPGTAHEAGLNPTPRKFQSQVFQSKHLIWN